MLRPATLITLAVFVSACTGEPYGPTADAPNRQASGHDTGFVDVKVVRVPDGPTPVWFANLQLTITDVMPVTATEEGLLADVSFHGRAGGPFIKGGTVVGVDHALFDLSGDAHLNVYLTITDNDGDQVSANITGLATFLNPGQYLLQGTVGAIINEVDPRTSAFHPTTGKYAQLVGSTFADIGFISAFSFSPPAGSVHANWYLH